MQRADALGVQSRGGDRKSEINAENSAMAPSQAEHAESIGVHRDTVTKWEKDRKEIVADPELAEKAKTFEGYQEAKKEVLGWCSDNFPNLSEHIHEIEVAAMWAVL